MYGLFDLNRAMEYIENNLTGEISYDRIAQLANCSVYHFQRMFPYITGIALSEYIRCRRLTRAADELQTTDIKIIDLALKYGYDSPEAFSRAFKKLHGVAPMSARDIGVTLKAYTPITFRISIQGDAEMNYRIEQRKAFQVFGKYAEISTDADEAFRQVPQFFRQCNDDGTTHDGCHKRAHWQV